MNAHKSRHAKRRLAHAWGIYRQLTTSIWGWRRVGNDWVAVGTNGHHISEALATARRCGWNPSYSLRDFFQHHGLTNQQPKMST